VPPALLFPGARPRTRILPPPCWGPSLLALLAALGAGALVRVPQTWLEGAFFGCWGVSVIVTAACVHLGRGP